MGSQQQTSPSPGRDSPYGAGPSYKLVISYDGSAYAGFQLQPDRATIQSQLERALAPVLGRAVRVQGSGRTDAGVHALQQVVSFDADCRLPDETLRRALNANLPADIHVRHVQRYEQGFHAIRNTTGKRYRYVIQDGRESDVFRRGQAWRVFCDLDEAAMAEGARLLEGRHDFQTFQASGAERKSTVRRIAELSVVREQPLPCGLVAVEVEADGFLYNMVRILVGTLVEIGKGRQSPQWAAEALAARRRDAAGMTAPPQGLFLARVHCDR